MESEAFVGKEDERAGPLPPPPGKVLPEPTKRANDKPGSRGALQHLPSMDERSTGAGPFVDEPPHLSSSICYQKLLVTLKCALNFKKNPGARPPKRPHVETS